MPIGIKGFVQKGLLTIASTLIAISFLLFPLFPVSQDQPIASWFIPVAYAQNDPFIGILERIGFYTRPRKGTAPTGRRVGGAGRGPICALADNEPSNKVKALMPFQSVSAQANDQEKQAIEPGNNTELVGGLTIAAHPTFWFYVPYISPPKSPVETSPKQVETSPKQVETSPKRVARFVLLDEANQPVWNELMNIELWEQPRLVEYPLSYTLETGKLYTWYFSVICDPEKLSRNPTVRGWVQRTDTTPELQQDLRDKPLKQYEVYADNKIWFEAVSSLVSIRRQFSSIHRDVWADLLASFDIPENNQLDGLASMLPVETEEVKGDQSPTRM